MTPTLSLSTTAAVSGTASVGLTATVVVSGSSIYSIDGVTCTDCDLNVDSGFYYDGDYSLSGHVYFDGSNDGGTYAGTPEDSPYSGIELYLYREYADGSTELVGSTTTDAGGGYTFTNLLATTYTVSLNPNSTKLIGTRMTYEPDESDGYCSLADGCNNRATRTITTSNITDMDFGFYIAWDFGDLPISYGTLFSSEGPRHIITNTLYLGTSPDAEGDSGVTALDTTATADNNAGTNDEDGIDFGDLSAWTAGSTVNYTATVYGTTGYLVAFFDWNQDGNFDDAGETVVYGDVVSGTNSLTVTIPAGFPEGSLYSRFRLYDGAPLQASPLGLADGGEVEDYYWDYTPPTGVVITSFSATARSGRIVVVWETASELDLIGFNIYRATSRSGPFVQLNRSLIAAQSPGSIFGSLYAWQDSQLRSAKTYYYMLEQFDLAGDLTQHGPVTIRIRSGVRPSPYGGSNG
jgi:hypothetical protein